MFISVQFTPLTKHLDSLILKRDSSLQFRELWRDSKLHFLLYSETKGTFEASWHLTGSKAAFESNKTIILVFSKALRKGWISWRFEQGSYCWELQLLKFYFFSNLQKAPEVKFLNSKKVNIFETSCRVESNPLFEKVLKAEGVKLKHCPVQGLFLNEVTSRETVRG